MRCFQVNIIYGFGYTPNLLKQVVVWALDHEGAEQEALRQTKIQRRLVHEIKIKEVFKRD